MEELGQMETENELNVRDLVEAFKKAIIIDIDKKTIWVIQNGKLKVYPEEQYKEFLSKLDLFNFEENGV